MYGRSCLCLLAISVLIPHPAVLRGQSRRDDAEFVRSLPPRAVLPPTREPFRHPSPVTQPVPIGLPPIARAAGTIFSGTVMAIARRPVNNGQTVETVAITFHVDNAIGNACPLFRAASASTCVRPAFSISERSTTPLSIAPFIAFHNGVHVHLE